MISLQKIDKSFITRPIFNKNKKIKVIERLSLDFNPGVINIITGINGSGKTTLLRLISRHLTQDRGKILIDGVPILKTHASLITNNDRSFFWRLTVKENLQYFLNIYNKHYSSKYLSELLDVFNIKEKLNTKFMKLSQGQKQIINIIRSIACNRNIILLDEPLNYLDDHASKQLISLLEKQTKQNKYVICATHSKSRFSNSNCTFINSRLFLNK